MPKNVKFPLCSKYGLLEQFYALADKRYAGIEIIKVESALSQAYRGGKEEGWNLRFECNDRKDEKTERIHQLEAEVLGLKGCCEVLEKAFGVPKEASLKQIDERIGYFVKLEGNLKAFEDVCRQYKVENQKLKQNKVYSCGNCEKLEKENTAMRKQIVDSCIRRG